MKLTVTAITKEQEGISRQDLTDMKEFSGKNAGICYGSHGYFGTAVVDPEKALNRFGVVAPTGHHSISDHANITVLFEGIPKIMAMLLNSMQVYCTSEKSGRYTEMTGSSDIERGLYDKWVKIFEDVISKVDSKADDKLVHKLAMENSRYLLSVFTPTTMSYTTSIRQWNYIIDWCRKYWDRKEAYEGIMTNKFNSDLVRCLSELGFELENTLYINELRDTKNRKFSFLAIQTNDIMREVVEERFSEQYTAVYDASFVQLAQAQRHRTIDYRMVFDGEPKEFFIPYVIMGTPLAEEWLEDMRKVAEIDVPQGTLVKVIEQGTIDDFFLKCQERLCGRAQIEVMIQTAETLRKMGEQGKFTEPVKQELDRYIKDGSVNAKCKLIAGGCKEPCRFGPNGALTRLV